jgi:hypothetical protein
MIVSWRKHALIKSAIAIVLLPLAAEVRSEIVDVKYRGRRFKIWAWITRDQISDFPNFCLTAG